MTKETEWIELFTGMSVTDGTDKPGVESIAASGEMFEKKRLAQRALLGEVRERLQAFKVEFQDAMSTEIKEGKLKGQKLLNERKTQLDEIEAEDFSADQLKMAPEVIAIIGRGSQIVINESERLREARFKFGEVDEPLFEKEEMQAEFWTPLMRERILPESYIPAKYSETQQMIDATNKYYLDEIDNRKEQGKLTPKSSRAKDILGSASEMMDLTSQMMGDFAPGSKEFKLATQLLSTGAAVLRQGVETYDKVKDRQFGDAASTALDIMGTLTQTVLEQCGVDKKTTKIVKTAFAAGSAAIAAGQAFAKGLDGVEDGLNALSNVCARSLSAAVQATSGTTQTNLKYAAATVPMAFKQAAIAKQIHQKVMDEDYAGIVTCLGDSMKDALQSAQALREIKLTQGKTEEEAKKIKEQLDKETDKLGAIFELSTSGGEILVKTAITAKRGEYVAALNALIGGVGSSLNKALVVAGLPKDQGKMIATYYNAAASAPAALQCLMNDPPKVDAALKKISGGISSACSQSGNDALAKVGTGLSMGLNAVATGLETKQLYAEKKYGEGIEAFVSGVKGQLDSVFQLSGVTVEIDEAEDGGGDDPGVSEETEDDDTPPQLTLVNAAEEVTELLKGLKDIGGDTAAAEKSRQALQKAESELIKKKADARKKADEEEATQILEEAKADLYALSEAQVSAAEASTIDALIAKMERDRMVMKLAQQIAEGGAAFLAKFVPALGAVSAGIKLAASLFAAGQRAQQLYKWLQVQDDLESAQSSLASSSRNFVKNQGDQLAHYAAQAIWAATELAGEIVKVAGPAGPAGAIIAAVATAGSAVQVVIEKHKSREELEAAWKITAKALRNPGNRKLGLQARALNGSLAKYSIAWGAIELKDPLARNAMKACDLNEASLNDENSNVDKVVAYLESFYEEDPSLYRELDEAPKWVPRDLELSLQSWARLKRRAAQSSQLGSIDTGKIDGWLALYETQSDDEGPAERTEAARKTWADAVVAERKKTPKGKRPVNPEAEQKAMGEALVAQVESVMVRIELLVQVKSGFETYKPVKKQGNPQQADIDAAAMLRAVALLAKQAGKAADALKLEQTGLKAQVDEVKVQELPVVEPEKV